MGHKVRLQPADLVLWILKVTSDLKATDPLKHSFLSVQKSQKEKGGEREREREKQINRQTDRQTNLGMSNIFWHKSVLFIMFSSSGTFF